MRRKKEHIITLHYQIFFDERSTGRECFITSVEPERLGLNWDFIKEQYNIVHHPSTKQITHVENRALGKVLFNAVEADQTAGHVKGSTAEIWTSIPKIGVPMLNIIHFHINDMSDEVSMDQRWLTNEERDLCMRGRLDQIQFKEFKRDASGMLLRYLILVHD